MTTAQRVIRLGAARAGSPSLSTTLVLVLLAVPARAQSDADVEPPAVSHDEVKTARVGEPVVVTATITDPSGVFDPAVLYRVGEQGDFLRLPMKPVVGEGEDWDASRFEAVIPGELVSGDLEYFIEAFDERGNGPARYADADLPVKVRVLRTAEPLPPVAGSAEDDDGGGALWVVAGVTAGALLLVGAAAAGVAGFVLLSPPAVPAQVDVVISAPTPIASGASP